MVTGMPGIGKSAFTLSLGRELTDKHDVRWAVADQFSDYYSIASSWYPDEMVPKDIDAICHMIQPTNDLLVIDDINLISHRHIETVQEMVNKLTNTEEIRMIFISRETSDLFPNFEEFQIRCFRFEIML